MPTMIAIGALLLFVGFWCLVMTAIAHLGGWAAIANQYPATGTLTGKTFWLQCGRFNWCDYNGCLTIRMSEQGLTLSMLLPFCPGHPPIFLPWSALKVIEVTDRWYGRYVTVDVGAPVLARVRLPLKIMEEAKRKNEVGS
jgi:hypothetical protein